MSNGNDSPIMFKTAVGGFDKKAVISYIFELNESSQAIQKKLKDQIEEITQAREALDQQLNEANKKLQRLQSDVSSLNNQLTAERNRSGETTAELARLNTEVEQQREQLAKRDDDQKNAETYKRRAAELELSVGKYGEEIQQLQQRLQEALAQPGDGDSEGLHARIAELEAQIGERDGEIEQLKSSVGQPENAGETTGEASQQIADLRDTVESLNAEIRRQREILARHETEDREGEQLHQQCQAKLKELEARQEDIETKQIEVDRSSAQVGRLLLDATSDAERMRRDAQQEGERMIDRAKQEAERLVAQANDQVKAAGEDVERTLAEAKGQVTAFKSYIQDLQEKLMGAASDVQHKSKEIGKMVEDVEQHFSQESRNRAEGVFFRNAAER